LIKNKEMFRWHNENPADKKDVQDCAIRALGYTHDGWDQAYAELCKIGFQNKCVPTSDEAITDFLIANNWTPTFPRKKDKRKYTLEEFAKSKQNGTYIIKTTKRYTVLENGKLVDINNYSDKNVVVCWEKSSVL
jgi:hypothetical protein